jgi:1-acyl-sn-glycerol-3-phosphate acyltransferase
MTTIYGSREIVRNPSLLRIDENESFIVEDKKAHKRLGVYLGLKLANDFFNYNKKQELLKSAKDRLNKGKHLVIFPEGTRNKNPKKLLPFKAGTKIIAEKYNLKVQPLLLLGIDEIVTFEPLRIKKGKLKVVVLPPREAIKNSNWYEELEKEMQEVVDNYYKGKQ